MDSNYINTKVKLNIYELCIEFYRYKSEDYSDMTTHISKLKNLWSELQIEMFKDEIATGKNCNLDLRVFTFNMYNTENFAR